MAGEWSPKSLTPPRPIRAEAADDRIWYHGTPDERTWEHGAPYGIHVGTEEAARQALHARIGKPAEGEWDGTREYGKTLLNRDYSIYSLDGTKTTQRNPPSYPTKGPGYSDGTTGPMDARPSIFPVRIKGPMTNHPDAPVTDDYANGRMRGQITRGNARRGYYYTNHGEDEGSISAAVPSAAHLERIHPPKTAAHGGERSYVLYHGAHHDDVRSILASGLRGDPDQPTVTTSREGAELYGRKRDWTAPKVLEIHVPRSQVHRYLGEPQEGLPVEGTVHALRETLPPAFIRAVHEASLRRGAAWSPQVGIFGPTTGLDPLLFDEGGMLRGQVRHEIMTRLDQCLRVNSGLAGSDWQEWLHVWLTGGSASEWAGSRPNEKAQDLDVIVAIDLPEAQGYGAFDGMNGGEAASALNAALWKHFNTDGWQPGFGGRWNLTAFCNQRAKDGIGAIKPYAAYDVTGMRWAVSPPHLPEHTVADFDPAVIAHARAVAAEARAILRMPEPLRTREARDLWEHVHQHRCTAFSKEGTGWEDPGNVDEKMLAYAPHDLLGKIKELALNSQQKTAAWSPEWPEDERSWRGERRLLPLTDLIANDKNMREVLSSGRRSETVGAIHVWPRDDMPGFEIGDGHHRVADAIRRGETHIDSEVEPWPDEEQYDPPFYDFSQHMRRESALAKTAAAQNPPCRYCGEPLDEEDVRDGHSAHEECSDMRWCEPHQEYHDDPQEAEGHNGTYTDWGCYLPFEGGIHRGLTVRLPEEAHRLVHDETRPAAERARVLKSHLDDGGHYGVHWTDHLPVAQAWGSDNGAVFGVPDPDDSSRTHVVLHAASPGVEHIEDDPEKLSGRNLWGFGHENSEREVPLKEGAPVHVTGISWKRGGESEWNRHDFGETAPKTASWDHSGSDHSGVYLRFGDWPHDERSFSPAGGYHEEGVSAYDLDRHGDPSIDHGLNRGHQHDDECDVDENGTCQFQDPWGEPDNDPQEEMRGRVARAERSRYYGSDKPSEVGHLVRGEMTGVGYDGEPLLKNVRRVGDWIDHRHLFLDQAKPHRLARDPSDEDYEEPEEKPPYGYRNRTAALEAGTQLYHGSLHQYAPGTVLTPEGKDAEGSRWSGDYVYAATSPEAARYFGSMHDTTPMSDADVHVHRVEPVGDVEPDEFPEGAEDERFARGNYRAKALRVLDSRRVPGHWAKTGAYEGERMLRNTHELGWSNEEWAAARREPWHAAAKLAQRQVRLDHPKTTMDFPRGEEGDRMVGHILRHTGYQGDVSGAFVSRHPDPARRTSNPAWLDGYPGVTLHPERWDYGTVAHEAAHHAVMEAHGVGPNQYESDEASHGPEWAGHYAQGLNRISKSAGDDFLAHHQFYRDLIGEGLQWKRPSDMDAADERWRNSGESYPRGPRPQQSHYGTGIEREAAAAEGPAGIRMVEPEEYRKYVFPDYPAKTLPALARHLRKNSPGYYDKLRADVQANGVRTPLLVRFPGVPGHPVKKPQVMDGHHRGAVASELGLPVPVGDYDNEEHYRSAMQAGQAWFRENHDLKAGIVREAAADPAYLHGGPNRVEPGGLIHQDAMPESYGRLSHNFFTTSRDVAEEAADMRNGLGHGWVHTVEPTGPFEVDPGEPDSWKSEAPLRVLSVEPGRLNGKVPHPPIVREAAAEHGPVYTYVPGSSPGSHAIVAHPAGAEQTKENRIGRLSWTEEPEGPRVVNVHVDEGCRRHGIATEMLRRAEEITPGIRHYNPSPDAVKWIEGMGKEAAAGDYRQPHQGPDAEDGEALHELGTKGFFPPDVHERPQDYGADTQTAGKIRKARGNPDERITMYRAMPSPHHKINTGDWVTLSEDYAREHAEESHPDDNYAVLGKVTRARHLRNDGNDLNEWTYHGPTQHFPKLVDRGGKNGGWKNSAELSKAQWKDVPPEDEMPSREAASSDGVPQRPKRTPGSAMVYLDVPHGTVEPYEGMETGHHVALAYLPRKIGDEDFARVVDRAREAAARHAPMKATISGGGVFPPGTPPDRRRAAVVPVHAPGIHELHREFSEFDRAHYEAYTPHVTRAQLGGHQADPPAHPEVSFPVTHVHVRRGDEVHSFPLTGTSRTEAALLDPKWREVQVMNGWTWDPTPRPVGKGYDTRPVSVRADDAVRDYLTHRSQHDSETDEEFAERKADIGRYGPWHKPKDRDVRVLEKYRDRALKGGPIRREGGRNGSIPQGTEFRHEVLEPPDDFHQITAEHPEHGRIGRITWEGASSGIFPSEVHVAEVHPDFRRRGIATELFRRASEITPGLHHAPEEAQGDDARAWIAREAAARTVCPYCGTYEDAHPQFEGLYHATSPAHRNSIRDSGLRTEFDQGEDMTEPGIYMSPHSNDDAHQDVWHVDIRGLRLHPDDPGNMEEFKDVGGSYFSKEDIPPERLHLHRPGTGNKWIGYPPKTAAAGPQFFHGTDSKLSEGDLIVPGRPKVNAGSDPRHVYFTEKYEHAEGAARGATDRRATSYDRENGRWVHDAPGAHYVYEVEPTGEWGQDEQLPWTPYSHQSAHPLRVVRDVTRRDGDMHREAVSGYDGLTGRSAMIYLDLPPGTVRLVPGGVDDHHVTLVYLGKNVSDEAFGEACRRTRAAAAKLAPMDGVLRGIDIFPPSKSSDGKVVAFVPAYIGSVGLLRRELDDLSASEHTDWRPHVTLAYLEEGDSLPAPHPAVPLRFDRIHVKRGDDVRSFPLGGMQRQAAAELPAYYHGTRYELTPGQVLTGGAKPANNPGVGRYEHVYMTRSPMGAHAAGSLAYDELGYQRGQPNVYAVEPLDPVERDPFTNGAVRSKRARVIRKVNPFTEPYDGDDD